jgi:hypothetical protein
MSVVQIDDGFGNMIDTVRFTGCNVQVVNGLGETESVNGAGNLIVGYNELFNHPEDNNRTGSHNIVGGSLNSYTSYGGLVVGWFNIISGQYASVSGGIYNWASGHSSSVSGGHDNSASGDGSSVSGGGNNSAKGVGATVSGGGSVGSLDGNTADGPYTSVSGGANNRASGFSASVSGGSLNWASGVVSSISGGCKQIADQPCQHLPCNHCPTDTNADGVVDVNDFLNVVLTWGKVCP